MFAKCREMNLKQWQLLSTSKIPRVDGQQGPTMGTDEYRAFLLNVSSPYDENALGSGLI